MKKKLLALVAAGIITLTMAGCGGTTVQLPTLSQPQGETSAVSGTESSAVEAEPVSDADFDDNLDGLCKYLEANYLVTSERTDSSFAEMAYQEIGAIGGYRYRFQFGKSTVQAEIYEFDLDNLDENATACLNGVKNDGNFKFLDSEIPAVISDNGKYLLIYTDSSKDEANIAQKAKAEEMFKSFKA